MCEETSSCFKVQSIECWVALIEKRCSLRYLSLLQTLFKRGTKLHNQTFWMQKAQAPLRPYQVLSNEILTHQEFLFRFQASQDETFHFLQSLKKQTFQLLRIDVVNRFPYSFLLFLLPFKNSVNTQHTLKVSFFPA